MFGIGWGYRVGSRRGFAVLLICLALVAAACAAPKPKPPPPPPPPPPTCTGNWDVQRLRDQQTRPSPGVLEIRRTYAVTNKQTCASTLISYTDGSPSPDDATVSGDATKGSTGCIVVNFNESLKSGQRLVVVRKIVLTRSGASPTFLEQCSGGFLLSQNFTTPPTRAASVLGISPQHAEYEASPSAPSAPVTFTVTNQSQQPTAELIATLIKNSGDGSFEKVSDTCTGVQLAASGTCTFSVIYTNDAHNLPIPPATGEVLVDEIGRGGYARTALAGQGYPGLEIFTSAGQPMVDTPDMAGANALLHVSNNSPNPVGPITASFINTLGVGNWTIVPAYGYLDCIGATLSVFGTCDLRVRYSNNTETGTGSTTVQVSAPGIRSGFTHLTGAGQPGSALELDTYEVTNFVDTPSGPGTSYTFTLTNRSNQPVGPLGFITIGLATAGGGGDGFDVTNTCPNALASLAAGASCTITVQYHNDRGSGKTIATLAIRPPDGDLYAELRGVGLP